MDLRRDKDGEPRIFRDRHFWIDESGQPIPEFIKPPCVVIVKDGVNFALEHDDVLRMLELLHQIDLQELKEGK